MAGVGGIGGVLAAYFVGYVDTFSVPIPRLLTS